MVMSPFSLPAIAEIEGQLAGQQFIEHNAKTIEIAAAVDPVRRTGGVLRRHIRQRTARLRQARRVEGIRPFAGEAKSPQTISAAGVDKKVAWFDIAVHQPLRMHLA